MSSQNRKPKRDLIEHVIETRHHKHANQPRTQIHSQSSQVSKQLDLNSQPSTNTATVAQLRTKKQRAKERGRQLQDLNKEKRALGLIKKSNKPRRTKSQKAGIYFPVSNFLEKLKNINPKCLVPSKSAVVISAVLEYLTAEVLELSGNVSIEQKRKRIIPRHIFLAMKNDQELELLFKEAVVTQGGTIPCIHPILLKSKKSRVVHKSTKETEHPDEDIPLNQYDSTRESTSNKRKNYSKDENTINTDFFEHSNKSNQTSTPAKKAKN